MAGRVTGCPINLHRQHHNTSQQHTINIMAGIYQTSQSAVSHRYVDPVYRISIVSPSPSLVLTAAVRSAPPVLSKLRLPNNHKADAARIFSTLLEAHKNAPPVQRPIIVRDVPPRVWEVFRDTYGEHHAFSASKFLPFPPAYQISADKCE